MIGFMVIIVWYWFVIIVFITFLFGALLGKNWGEDNLHIKKASTQTTQSTTIPPRPPNLRLPNYVATVKAQQEAQPQTKQQQEMEIKIKKEHERIKTWLYGSKPEDVRGE